VKTRLWRLFWLMILVGHVLLAAFCLWAQPGGFPAGHPRFWSNRVAPVCVLAVAIAALAALRRESMNALRLLLPAWAAAWAAAGIASRVVFPSTLVWLWLLPEAAAASMALGAIPVSRGFSAKSRAGSVATALASGLFGAALVLTQQVPVPATRPLNVEMRKLDPLATTTRRQRGAIRLKSTALVQSFDGAIMIRESPLTITLQPLLTFLSRSPDGCPTVFVKSDARAGPEPRLVAASRTSDRSCEMSFDLRGQGPASLDVTIDSRGKRVIVESMTRLDQPVYSHLNSFCDIEIRGHRQLALGFSPCAGAPIAVQHFDYPIGRPARFAFLDKDGTFKVVQASSGEKGPFQILASGPLGRHEALSITLYDQEQPMARITLEDWASQAAVALSPTAGWGVPVNAIEFSLSGDAPSAPASIFVTLAGTSVGRGWDCVGHTAGTYRNRIQIESLFNAKSK
jgi:hypothetical protein